MPTEQDILKLNIKAFECLIKHKKSKKKDKIMAALICNILYTRLNALKEMSKHAS